MIIGIDDSGNFDSDHVSFYGAVFIRPKRYEKIRSKFLAWEAQLPESAKERGEVKGRLLNDEQLVEFADQILINNGYGAVKLQVFGIEINDNHNQVLRDGQIRNVAQMKQQAKEVYRDQGKEYTQIAAFYEQMSAWLASKTLKTMYKMELLSIVIVKSFNLAIVSSTLRSIDKELDKLEINIDQGITGRPSVERYWQDIMRTMFWHITSYAEPIIHISEWKPNHPFLKRFYKYPKSRERLGVFTQEIRKLFRFYDSREKYEVRLADIVASTFFRQYVKNEPLDRAIGLMLRQRIEFGGSYVNVKLGGKINPDPVNPYTDRINGVTVDELEEMYGGS